ncbi:acyltransferase [Ruminococcaceae bacterium OttesenSCG-928-A16]|nr:acyltransferase [Ruminococcaceae bacterium OttesenSCG-928-A16]
MAITAKQGGGRQYPALDSMRMVAAVLVITVHTQPLSSINPLADTILTGIIARLAVPFFFMCSGYFFVKGLPQNAQNGNHERFAKLLQFTKKTAGLYGLCILIYLPLNVYMGDFANPSLTDILRRLFLDGSVYTLWYLPAVLLGMWVVYGLYFKLGKKAGVVVAVLLYAVALGGDSYFGIVKSAKPLATLYGELLKVLAFTRNGLFMAPLFIMLGFLLAKKPALTSKTWANNRAAFVVCFCALLAEGILLELFSTPRHNSMYVFLPMASWFLFRLLAMPAAKGYPGWRNLSMWVYILHLWAIVLVRGVAKIPGLAVLVQNSVLFFVAVCMLTLPLCMGAMWLQKQITTIRHRPKIYTHNK